MLLRPRAVDVARLQVEVAVAHPRMKVVRRVLEVALADRVSFQVIYSPSRVERAVLLGSEDAEAAQRARRAQVG